MPEPLPFEVAHGSGKQRAPAVARNREALLAVLQAHLPQSGLVLEVASGTGEHAAYFAQHLPGLIWQPTDPEAAALASITAWRRDAALTNLQAPVQLDAMAADWPITRADALFCANMVHIAPWQAARGLFAAAGRMLAVGAPLLLYGPFLEADVPTAESNIAFDGSLRARNPAWGLRDAAALDALAQEAGLARTARIAMPANNLTLVWRKKGR